MKSDTKETIICILSICLILSLIVIGEVMDRKEINSMPAQFYRCGMLADNCPDGYILRYIGGQCIRCFKSEYLTTRWNLTDLCGEIND